MEEKQDNKESDSSFINNISEIYKKINFYRNGFVIAITCAVIQSITILCLLSANPIVIQEKDGERLGYIGNKKEIVITEGEIKELVRKFIKNRYEWLEFKPYRIAKELTPFTKSALVEKITKKMIKNKQQMKEQKVKQYVGRIIVSIDKKNQIVGSFDKILRVGNIPLISQAQVLIGIVKGAVTRANKLGLYINSVVNYEPN